MRRIHKSIMLIMVRLLVFSISSCSGEEDHDDGKCDICGKKATYSSENEEYCDKHSLEAAIWYLEKSYDE